MRPLDQAHSSSVPILRTPSESTLMCGSYPESVVAASISSLRYDYVKLLMVVRIKAMSLRFFSLSSSADGASNTFIVSPPSLDGLDGLPTLESSTYVERANATFLQEELRYAGRQLSNREIRCVP
jgi:hypothetical protein